MGKKNIIITEQQFSDLITGDIFKNISSALKSNDLFDIQKFKDELAKKQSQTNAGDSEETIDSEELKTVRKNPGGGSKSTYTSPPGDAQFQDAINKIIDGLEGGYYHPNMKARNPSKFAVMGSSGETMYGMDRKHGKQEQYAAGQEFWKLIDAENASTNWGYNYKLDDNPGLASKLKKLIADIMKPLFEKFSNTYLSPEAKQIVMSNPPLYVHFVYATWNGSGWFKKFAKTINEEVAKGITDPGQLGDIAVQSRKNSGNSILSKTSTKVDNIMDTMA